MTSTFIKTVDFFVPVLEPRPGYIRGVLKDAFTSMAVVAGAFVFTGYLDKAISADLGVYNWAQGYDVENGGVTYVAEPIPTPTSKILPLELQPVTELLNLPDEPIIVPPIQRAFHDIVLCSVDLETGDAFLFDGEEDAHVDSDVSQVEGSVVFEAFNTERLADNEFGQAGANVTGHCTFHVEKNGERTYYVADAYPSSIAGNRQQLLDPNLTHP